MAEEVLEDHLHRVGEPGDVEPVGQGVDPVDLVGGVADREVAAGAEGVGVRRRWGSVPWPHSAPRSGEPGPNRATGRRSGAGAVAPDGQRDEDDRSPMVQARVWMTHLAVGPPIISARQALTVTLTGW